MSTTCAFVPELHAFVDRELPAEAEARVENHLVDCSKCRDVVRSLRRIDLYLARPLLAGREEPRAHCAEAVALEPTGRIQDSPAFAGALTSFETASHAGRVPVRRAGPSSFGLRLALAASVLLCLIFAVEFGGRSSESGLLLPRSESLAVSPESQILFDLDPDLEVPCAKADLVVAFKAWEAKCIEGDPNPAAWIRATCVDPMRPAGLRLRAFRVAATLDLRDTRWKLAGLLESGTLNAKEALYGLRALAEFGGQDVVPVIRRVADGLELAPPVRASVLLETCALGIADEVWQLLIKSGTAVEDAYVAIARLPGRSATNLLLQRFLAGDDAPVLGRLLAGRRDAWNRLRGTLRSVNVMNRVRVLRLLGEHGDAQAVPDLVRMIERGDLSHLALRALVAVAQSGSERALASLVDLLPPADQIFDRNLDLQTDLLLSGMGSLGQAAQAVGRRAVAEGSSRPYGVERRKWLLSLGVLRCDDATPELRRALSRPTERRAAIAALGWLRCLDAVPDLGAGLTCADRSARILTIDSLIRIGGDSVVPHLMRSLQRSEDRRAVVARICERPEPWMRPLMLEGQKSLDSNGSCTRALRALDANAAAAPDVARNSFTPSRATTAWNRDQ